MLFDTHCHLCSDQLSPRLDDLLERAAAAGVSSVLNIGDSIGSSRLAIEQARQAQKVHVWASCGVHPHQAQHFDFEFTPGDLRELLGHKEAVALGEIGLDFFYDESNERFPGAPRAIQERVFEAQLEIAQEMDLPVVIHNRDADDRLLAIVRSFPSVRGVFHCFASTREVAEQVLGAGFHLGFGGMATFKNAQAVRDVAAWCPADKLLLETDAPYLAPVPHRGKQNEPAFVADTARFIADLRGVSSEELAHQTSLNARVLFRVAANATPSVA
jgi:TatD DNase family protein